MHHGTVLPFPGFYVIFSMTNLPAEEGTMLIKKDFFVDFRSVDAGLNIKNSGILGMFEDIACLHGCRCGEDISTSDLRWLLVGYRVNILRRPRYGEEVEVTTWSKDYRGVSATREFELRGPSGELLATGWSNWARVNIRTKELVRLTDEAMAAYQSEPERTNFGKAPRITAPANFDSSVTMTVDWRWMDNNRHLHNSYYLDIAERVLPDAVHAQLPACGFDVTYKQEITEDAVIVCQFTETEDSWFVTFRSEDLSVLHAVVVYHRPTGEAEKSDTESVCESESVPSKAQTPEKRPRVLFARRGLIE